MHEQYYYIIYINTIYYGNVGLLPMITKNSTPQLGNNPTPNFHCSNPIVQFARFNTASFQSHPMNTQQSLNTLFISLICCSKPMTIFCFSFLSDSKASLNCFNMESYYKKNTREINHRSDTEILGQPVPE